MPSARLTTIPPHHDLHRISHSIRHLRSSSSSSITARPPRPSTASQLPNRIPRISPHRTYSTTPTSTKQYPTIPTCPPSICSCAPMPSGLDIDYKRAMSGTMPPYAQHVVISTGRDDWGRKIEEEDGSVEGGSGMNVARSLRERVGRGGKWFDPERPILISNSSFPVKDGPGYSSVQVFPQNVYVPRIEDTVMGHDAFVEQFIGPNRPTSEWDSVIKRKAGLEQIPMTSPTILICGHNSRDSRCGILGPLLRAEFESYFGRRKPSGDSLERQASDGAFGPRDEIGNAQVALVSHIGGHAFAGNVIVYLPPGSVLRNGQVSPLAGMGIWYGRVEPRHVWGIMETIERGEVIEELLRGIHKPADMDG